MRNYKKIEIHKLLIPCLVFMLFGPCLINAGIIDYNCIADGDGAIVMGQPSLTYNSSLDEYTLSIGGTQYWGPAHLFGEFIADGDPTILIAETVENETDFEWTDYHIAIGMNHIFSILTDVIEPDNWIFDIQQPVGGQLLPNGNTGWIGTIDYYIGTGSAVAIGDSADFGLKISFEGSVEFCTEQYPTPEPATLVLLGIGTLAFMRRKLAIR